MKELIRDFIDKLKETEGWYILINKL